MVSFPPGLRLLRATLLVCIRWRVPRGTAVTVDPGRGLSQCGNKSDLSSLPRQLFFCHWQVLDNLKLVTELSVARGVRQCPWVTSRSAAFELVFSS
eukprot:633963-Rhodomonas_salina.1